MNCLVIDQDKDAVKYVEGVLKVLGWSYRTALSGSAGMMLFTREPRHYQLVITDLVLPDTSGLVVAHAVRQLNPQAQVVFYTYHPAKGPIYAQAQALGRCVDKCALGAGLIEVLQEALRQ